MTELLPIGTIFVLAVVSAFVPLVSIELALVVAAAASTPDELLVAEVVAAAAGQMVGKSCFFLGGRAASIRWTRRRNRGRVVPGRRLARLIASATRQRAAAAATVFVSAVTGLPPFALVSALAGGWRLRLPAFFVLGLAGRSARFAGVLVLPDAPAW